MISRKQAVFIFIVLLNAPTLQAKNDITIKEATVFMEQGVLGVKKLLKKISLYKVFEEDQTLLHLAVKEGDYDVVSFLVNQDILLSEKGGDFYGTPLQDAIYYGYSKIAIFLIEKGTFLNVQNIEGNTALHIAADKGDLTVIKSLLAYGASKLILNNDGKTPLSLVPDLTFENDNDMKKLLSLTKNKPIDNDDLSFGDKALTFDDKDLNFNDKSLNFDNKINTKSKLINSSIGIKIK